ncbi:phage baseplate assembly protein V [Streptomyces canus]|uniref:phage baseplate assembly protein V n=1 Tax=Streptomyces canus TaxID=58343 RepID=UPI0036B2B742
MTWGVTGDRLYYGVTTAVVIDVKDKGQQCQVRLQLPWFDKSACTDWCPVVQPYAGKGHGIYFVPEEKDQVLVAFEHGEMRKPFVLGALYSNVDRAPTARDDTTDQKSIRTKGGHQVVLDDSPGKKALRVTSAGGHSVQLDDAAKKVTLTTSGGQSVVLDDAAGQVTVTARTTLTLQVGAMRFTLTAEGAVVGPQGAPAVATVLAEPLLKALATHVHPTPSGPPVTAAVFAACAAKTLKGA